MIDTTNIELYKRTDNWNGILKACHCKMNAISDEVLSSHNIQLMLDVAMAYSQLSNLRRIKDEKTHKTIGYNEQEADACFVCANTIFQKVLEKDPKNTLALQSYAYDCYKYLVDYFGINRKEVMNMPHVDIAKNFKKMNALYDTLLAVPNLGYPSQIKARYRRGRAWSYIVYSGYDERAREIVTTLNVPYHIIRNHAISDLEFVVNTYAKITEAEQKPIYNLYIKSLFNLGKLFGTSVYDNATQAIPQLNNKTILQLFIEDPEKVNLSYYKFPGKINDLFPAEHYFLAVLNEYKVKPFETIDMQFFVKRTANRKVPISPRDVFYRLGNVYNKWYRIYAIYNKRRDIMLSKGYSGVYYYFMALQYCLWCDKLHIPCSHYDYIIRNMNTLKRAISILDDDSHIQHMYKLFERVLDK